MPSVACSTRRARCSATSTAVTSAPRPRGDRAEQPGLAARAGAQVEPAGVAARRSARPAARRRPAGSPRPARGPGRRAIAASSPGEPPLQVDRVRRERAGRAADLVGQLDRVGPARAGRTGAPAAGWLSSISSRAVSSRSPPSASANARMIHCGWLCSTARLPTGSVVVRRRQLGQPGVQVAVSRRSPAAPRWRSRPRPGATARTRSTVWLHRGVRRHPGVEQLVGAEPQRVAGRRVDPGHVAAGGVGDDQVEGAERRAGCRRSARWRTRRPGRAAACSRRISAGPGWRTRRRGAPRRSPRTPPAGPGPTAAGRPAAPGRRGRRRDPCPRPPYPGPPGSVGRAGPRGRSARCARGRAGCPVVSSVTASCSPGCDRAARAPSRWPASASCRPRAPRRAPPAWSPCRPAPGCARRAARRA